MDERKFAKLKMSKEYKESKSVCSGFASPFCFGSIVGTVSFLSLRNKVRVQAYIFFSVLKYNRRTEDEA